MRLNTCLPCLEEGMPSAYPQPQPPPVVISLRATNLQWDRDLFSLQKGGLYISSTIDWQGQRESRVDPGRRRSPFRRSLHHLQSNTKSKRVCMRQCPDQRDASGGASVEFAIRTANSGRFTLRLQRPLHGGPRSTETGLQQLPGGLEL